MILKKNDFQTVQEWNQAYIDRFIGQENEFFPNKKKKGPPTTPLFYKVNWTAPKYNFLL